MAALGQCVDVSRVIVWRRAVRFKCSREDPLQESRDRLARPSWVVVVAISQEVAGRWCQMEEFIVFCMAEERS